MSTAATAITAIITLRTIAHSLTSVGLADKGSTIKGELSLVAFQGARLPIETFLFLHPPDDSMGECGDVRPACVVTSLGDRLSCR